MSKLTNSRKIRCLFPEEIIEEPLLYNIGSSFDVIPNIRGASVAGDQGAMDLELEGEESEIERVIAYLVDRGVSVSELS